MSPDPIPLRPTILLVEDEVQIRNLVALALRRAGYEVTAAATGCEALARLAEAGPDLVISDVTMPDLDGFDLLRHMRSDPGLRAISLMLLSGRAAPDEVALGLDLGADDYLRKPFNISELLARVRVRLERPPVPRDLVPHNRQTTLMSERNFEEELHREWERIRRGGAPGSLACLYLAERITLQEHLSLREHLLIARHLIERIGKNTRLLDSATHDVVGHFLILLPATNLHAARIPMRRLIQRITSEPVVIDNMVIPLTPRVGIASFRGAPTVEAVQAAAQRALDQAIAEKAEDPVLATTAARAPQPAAPAIARPTAPLPTLGPAGHVVLVLDDAARRAPIHAALVGAGYGVMDAPGGRVALDYVAAARPDLIIADARLRDFDGFQLVQHLRADPGLRPIPVLLLTGFGAPKEVLSGLALGADDCLPHSFALPELLARVRARIARPPVPRELLPRDPQTALFGAQVFAFELSREVARAGRNGPPGVLACLELDELPGVAERLGGRATAEIAKQVGALLGEARRPLDIEARDHDGCFAILLPETTALAATAHLEALGRRIMGHTFTAAGERIHLTPTIGCVPFTAAIPLDELRDRARVAQTYAASLLDLRPQVYTPVLDAALAQQRAAAAAARKAPWWERLYTELTVPIQIGLTLIIGMVIPFCGYAILDALGFDITPFMYLVVAAALLLTSYFIWIEGLLALDPDQPPAAPATPYPPASAIIAAYLPNEAATVVDTIEAFLAVDYPAPLQIILAYNTPRDMPIEAVLHALEAREPRFLALRVAGSTSKAQNVNAALAVVTGAFVGVFDADHHPLPASFKRAWRWLSHGYDVVQGHCLVRNGDASWMARLVAVEFEAIYAVSHPGRARLHQFGIFGGSNGYWKTPLLRQTRMRGSMLTEDIDSSLRALEAGHRLASDPYLVSRELATTTVKATWNQRMRWAQGWFQVSLKHFGIGLRCPNLSPRQKFGLFHLLAWREIYPWLSIQIFPILGYWAIRAGGFDHINWLVPAWVLLSLFTASVGPGQFLFAYLLAAPEIQRRSRWFLFYLLMAMVFYTEFKNIIARVAQIKELMYERAWKVTPRAISTTSAAAPTSAAPPAPPAEHRFFRRFGDCVGNTLP